jgi:hypothetical protein
MITPDAPASIHHLFPLMAALAFGSLNDIALGRLVDHRQHVSRKTVRLRPC